MAMGSKKEIERIEPQGELYRCPSCDYSDGFHVSFKMGKTDRKATEADVPWMEVE